MRQPFTLTRVCKRCLRPKPRAVQRLAFPDREASPLPRDRKTRAILACDLGGRIAPCLSFDPILLSSPMPFIRWTRRVLVLVTLLAFTDTCFAVRPTETILYTFTGGADGGGPCCVVADAAGNLYGEIGMHIDGAIFEVYSSGGIWTEKVLYQFQGGNDGSGATGGMIFDASGNLYGTTYAGGGSANCSRGCGTVFELSPPSMPGGSWTETVLYSFEGGPADGASPMGALIFDQGGSLYGMTRWGGGGNCPVNDNTGCGTVFRVTPPSEPGGPWTETVLYSFQGGEDGNAAGGAQNGVIF